MCCFGFRVVFGVLLFLFVGYFVFVLLMRLFTFIVWLIGNSKLLTWFLLHDITIRYRIGWTSVLFLLVSVVSIAWVLLQIVCYS